MNSHSHRRPRPISHSTGDTARRLGPPVLAWTQPHSLDLSTLNTVIARPQVDNTAPHVDARLVRRRLVHDAPREQQDDHDDDDLAREHPAPGEERRHEPADQRPRGDRHGGAAISPYTAERRELGEFAATSATIAGMISAAPRPSSTDQPMSRTVSVGDSAVVSDPTP